MRFSRWRQLLLAIPALLMLVGTSGCQPVAVLPGQVTSADVAVVPDPPAPLNILGVGIEDAQGRIILRSTGTTLRRGATTRLGVMGPGIEPGTKLLVGGARFSTVLERYARTTGGGVDPQPAAVLSVTVPADAPAGIYSIFAIRDHDYAVLSGGIEVP